MYRVEETTPDQEVKSVATVSTASPISDLSLGTRVKNVLAKGGARVTRDIYDPETKGLRPEVEDIRGIGKKSMEEIAEALEKAQPIAVSLPPETPEETPPESKQAELEPEIRAILEIVKKGIEDIERHGYPVDSATRLADFASMFSQEENSPAGTKEVIEDFWCELGRMTEERFSRLISCLKAKQIILATAHARELVADLEEIEALLR